MVYGVHACIQRILVNDNDNVNNNSDAANADAQSQPRPRIPRRILRRRRGGGRFPRRSIDFRSKNNSNRTRTKTPVPWWDAKREPDPWLRSAPVPTQS